MTNRAKLPALTAAVASPRPSPQIEEINTMPNRYATFSDSTGTTRPSSASRTVSTSTQKTRRTTPVITGGRLRRCRSATGLQRITHVNGRLKMAIREAAPDLGPPLAPACRRASARVANVGGCDTAGAYADDRRAGAGPDA